MQLPVPSTLAPLLPLKRPGGDDPSGEVVVHLVASLGAAYELRRFDIAAKIALDSLPAQVHKQVMHGDESWYLGVNIFREGVDIKYQTFFWMTDLPPQTRLSTAKPRIQQTAGNVVTLNLDASEPTASSVRQHKYNWNVLSATLLHFSFSQEAEDCTVHAHTAKPQPQIAKTTDAFNDSSANVHYTADVSYEYAEALTTTTTDRHSFETGVKLGWEAEVGWFAAKAKFTAEIELKYGFERTTSKEHTTTSTYSVRETQELDLAPHEHKYVSIIIYADHNATATIDLGQRLMGKVGGKALAGEYLKKLALAMDSSTQVDDVGTDWVRYRTQAFVEAAIATDSKVIVSDSPPRVENGQVVAAGAVVQQPSSVSTAAA